MKDACSAVSKLLEKYFDQEVTKEERSFVEAHLLDCSACRDALRFMEELRTLIKVPVEEAVQKEDFPWVWQKIERGIRLEERPTFWETLQSWLQISSIFQRKVWIPFVATIAVLLFVTTQFIIKKTPSYSEPYVVEYIESETYNIMIFESEKAKTTVIWLFEVPEQKSSTS